jgi:hypothetical protein
VQKHQVGKSTFVFHITEECAIILYFGAILHKLGAIIANFGADTLQFGANNRLTSVLV